MRRDCGWAVALALALALAFALAVAFAVAGACSHWRRGRLADEAAEELAGFALGLAMEAWLDIASTNHCTTSCLAASLVRPQPL